MYFLLDSIVVRLTIYIAYVTSLLPLVLGRQVIWLYKLGYYKSSYILEIFFSIFLIIYLFILNNICLVILLFLVGIFRKKRGLVIKFVLKHTLFLCIYKIFVYTGIGLNIIYIFLLCYVFMYTLYVRFPSSEGTWYENLYKYVSTCFMVILLLQLTSTRKMVLKISGKIQKKVKKKIKKRRRRW